MLYEEKLNTTQGAQGSCRNSWTDFINIELSVLVLKTLKILKSFTLEQATKAQRESTGIAVLFL